MTPELLEVLCCPACRSTLSLQDQRVADQEILVGELVCPQCPARYPISNGIPRFVRGDAYVSSFSFEWQKWSRVQIDSYNGRAESEETFREKTGFTPDDLRGKLVLDVGCGGGRFLDVVSRWGARAVGVDLSFAVDAARHNLGTREKVQIVQASVFALPFRDRAFDAVFSIGVLHHTPDTRKAFLCLPRLVHDGGEIAVWVYYYPDRLYRWASDCWRMVFRLFPSQLKLSWCRFLADHLAPLYRNPSFAKGPLSVVPRLLPASTHPDPQWGLLDTFDWYTPRYQDKACSPLRVYSWFREGGLREIEFLDYLTSLRGRGYVNGDHPELRRPMLSFASSRVVVFGAGSGGDWVFEVLRKAHVVDRVVAVCDNDPAKIGKFYHGHRIMQFSDLNRSDYDGVIIASLPGRTAIASQLEKAGLVARQDFISLQFLTHVILPFGAQFREAAC